jgi:hypothetical protein
MEPIVLAPEPKEPIVLGPSVPDFDLTPGDISRSHSVAPEGSRGCWHRLVHTIRAGLERPHKRGRGEESAAPALRRLDRTERPLSEPQRTS